MVQALSGNELQEYIQITSLGLFCLNVSDFFLACMSVIRIRSPPSKTRNLVNFEFLEVIMKEKSYDELNKYDFIIKYYLKFLINSKIEDFIEITQNEYEDLESKLEKEPDSNIKIFKTYTVGFYKSPECYVEQVVDKDVFECLQTSQIYEKNKVKHERDRYLTNCNEDNDVDIIPDKENLEKTILDKVSYEELLEFAKSIFAEKQYDRFYKHLVLEIPFTVIASLEDVTIPAVWESIDRAIETFKSNYEKYNKNKKN